MSYGTNISSCNSNNVEFRLYYDEILEDLDTNKLLIHLTLTVINHNSAAMNIAGWVYSLRAGTLHESRSLGGGYAHQNVETNVASLSGRVPADTALLMRGYLEINGYGITSITTPDAYHTFSLPIKSYFTYSGNPHANNTLTLGTRTKIFVTKPSSGSVSTLYYDYGTGRIPLYDKSGLGEFSCTPPLSMANSFTNVQYIRALFTIETYWDNGDGTYVYKGNDQETFRIDFPSSMKPSGSLSITDGNGYLDDFGSFLHSESTYAVSITDILSYGSPIVSYNTVVTGVTADGDNHSSNYYGKTFTTNVLNILGTVTFTTTLVDARGRTGVVTKTVNAIRYVPPLIYDLAVHRCDQDGTEDGQGEYVTFSFSSIVQSLTNNTAHYWFKYKSSEDQSYTVVDLPTLQNDFSVTNHSEIIPANSDYSYEIVVLVQDGVMTTQQSTRASTAATILNFSPGGTGIGIGKVSEEENLLDVGMPTRFSAEALAGIGLTDTGWINLNSAVKYRVKSGVCYVVGESSGIINVAAGGYTVVGTLPSQCRPSIDIPFVRTGMGGVWNNQSNYVYASSGDIALYSNVTDSAHWAFSLSFPI